LDSWCAGVGPASIANRQTAAAGDVTLSDITFVSWNVHVGNGNLTEFVRDLRAGRLTPGRVPRQIVLLLQEAVRAGAVPALASGARGARRISAAHQDNQDIETVSEVLGMSMVYAPSMRNGAGAHDRPADRGSAILATLPLSRPIAVELPFERQRRVAIFATVPLANGASVDVGVIHLDALTTSRKLWVFGVQGWRAAQAEALLPMLPAGSLVVGADLNSWLGPQERAPRYLAQVLNAQAAAISENSAKPRRRTLDYLFFRAEPSTAAQLVVVPDKYGSDHHPLVGWFNNSP
jgi:endonuclease/exonuclease/phosphatase family metal-dependent hydrolase